MSLFLFTDDIMTFIWVLSSERAGGFAVGFFVTVFSLWLLSCLLVSQWDFNTRDIRLKPVARSLFYASTGLFCLGGLVIGLGFFPVHPSLRLGAPFLSTTHSVLATGLGLAAITSCLASAFSNALASLLGHRYVSSRTLGGSGVEPMSLVLRGRGPALDFILSSEEGHGSIRL